MSTRKTIQINPNLFNIKSNKSDKKRTKKEKPEIKETSLKRELMKRIKKHANQAEKPLSSDTANIGGINFNNDFDKHLDYLSNLSKDTKKEKRRQKKNTRKVAPRSLPTTTHQSSIPSAFLDLPPELNDNSYTINVQEGQQPSIKLTAPFQPEPPYGCLKGGGKPTFKDWKRKTQKNTSTYNSSDVNINMDKMNENSEQSISNNGGATLVKSMIAMNEPTPDISPSILKINPLLNVKSERERKLEGIKDKMKKKTEHDEIKTAVKNARAKKEPRRFKYNKTVKHTYGKSNGKITVCIKDSQTRKNIIQEQVSLRQKPINEIKEFLKSKYLLKAGSHAPNDILRKMYEEVHLAGDIININESNLLHNYMNDKESTT